MLRSSQIKRWDAMVFDKSDLHLPEKNDMIAANFEVRAERGRLCDTVDEAALLLPLRT